MPEDREGGIAPFRMHVEGWRGYAHSIARVNQWQLVELVKRSDVDLTFSDAKMHFGLKQERGLFPSELERLVWGVPTLPFGQSPDVDYRITSRVDVQPSLLGAERLMIFAVAEYLGQHLDLVGAQKLSTLSRRDDLTVVVPSNWVREILAGQGLDQSRIAVVPHGVNTDVFRPDRRARRRVRAELNLDRFVFLNVGAMSGNKGIVNLLKAFKRVLDLGITATLILKGNDKIYDSKILLDGTIANFSDSDRTKVVDNLRYIGHFMSDEEMVGLYNASDCYISPYIAEGFNLPVLEAMACGLPVVCTAGGPTDDFTDPSFSRRIQSRLELADDGIGWLKPSLDHLTDLMTAMYYDEEFRAQAREAGPAYARANFTWEKVVDKLVAVARGE